MNTNADKDNVNELSLFAQKRLLKDIKNIHCDKTLKDNGVYYVHSMSEMAKGYALIIGPEDSPYQHGAYLFEIVFPDNYPHSPPKFKYLTNDGKTRYHPNLYTNGKVCLSILGTWTGPKWSSIQTLKSTLLSIQSLLNDNPIQNEPGWENKDDNDIDSINYKEYIRYNNYYYAMLHMLQDENFFPYFKNLW